MQKAPEWVERILCRFPVAQTTIDTSLGTIVLSSQIHNENYKKSFMEYCVLSTAPSISGQKDHLHSQEDIPKRRSNRVTQNRLMMMSISFHRWSGRLDVSSKFHQLHTVSKPYCPTRAEKTRSYGLATQQVLCGSTTDLNGNQLCPQWQVYCPRTWYARGNRRASVRKTSLIQEFTMVDNQRQLRQNEPDQLGQCLAASHRVLGTSYRK